MNKENANRWKYKGRREIAAALVLYPTAYLYARALTSSNYLLCLGLFTALFVLVGEYLCWGRKRPAESVVWFCCLALITAGVLAGRDRVWGPVLPIFFMHIFAVWWYLSRAGKLVDGESGRFLPLDALNGFVRIPFGNFFLRITCLRRAARSRRNGEQTGRKKGASVAAVLLGALLLYWAVSSLAAADSGFERLVEGLLEALRLPVNVGEFVLRLLLSLPVGAWLFGLLAGAPRVRNERLREERNKTEEAIAKLRVVPGSEWTALAAMFIAVYVLFFAMQGSYLFGAFVRRLPEGFIVSQYARRGFFELCRAMTINFALLWLMTRTGRVPEGRERTQKIMCTLLLAASMLFAVVAFSKLMLYISCFGFTPKRLQSSWLVTVLFAGCAAALYNLWTGKKAFKYWMMFGAVTLSVLCIW